MSYLDGHAEPFTVNAIPVTTVSADYSKAVYDKILATNPDWNTANPAAYEKR